MTIQATLCFIIHNNRVLLLKKNPGLFGAGKWNAPGGKLQPKETAEQCASREVYEGDRAQGSKAEKDWNARFLQVQQTRRPGLDSTRIPHETVPRDHQGEQRRDSPMVPDRSASIGRDVGG